MMTIHKLTAGDGYTYLTRHVAGGDVQRERGQSAADYYTAEGNPPGRWIGSGVGQLGLEGQAVTEAQMKALFGLGMHPDLARIEHEFIAERVRAGMTQAQVAQLGRDARVAATLGRAFPQYAPLEHYQSRVDERLEVIRAETGREPTRAEIKKAEMQEARRQRAAVAGYDVVFAPVKSAAILWAIDPRVQVHQAVREAHEQAKNAAIAMIEQHAAFTRAGAAGIAQIETTGLIAAAFDHYDSRTGDPNLHTHVAISNKVRGVDGVWRSLDARAIYRITVAASEHYNTAFETALTARLGVRFEPRANTPRGKEPVREIAGIPLAYIEHFSARRTEIEARYAQLVREYRREHHHDPSRQAAYRLARQANLETREGKKPARSLQQLRADWTDTLTGRFGHKALRTVMKAVPNTPAATAVAAPDIAALAARAVANVAEARSTWTVWNLRAEAERLLRADQVFPDLNAHQRAVEQVTAAACAGHSVPIETPTASHLPSALTRSDGASVYSEHAAARYTSTIVLDAEARLLAAARTATAIPTHGVVAGAALAAFQARTGQILDPGQRALVAAFAQSPRLLGVGIGPAGSGKTTAMRALAAVLAADGRRVIPLATSSSAADVLGKELGVRAENLHKFLFEHTHGAHAHRLDAGARVTERLAGFALRPGDVVLVDEAGMAGTLQLDRLTAIAHRHGVVVRLLGDHRQLGAIETGGALRLLTHDTDAVQLTTLYRFRDPAEADATLKLRVGDPGALEFYARNNRIVSGSRDGMTESAYQAWKHDMLAGKTTILPASSGLDTTRLSAQARQDRVAAGQVTPRGVALRDGNLAGTGDWILTRDNQRTLTTNRGRDFVKNGDAWRVVKQRRDGSLDVQHLEHRGRVRLPATYVAAHVQLYYAVTVIRTQGTTVDTAHPLITPEMTREQLYVAASRARQRTTLHVATHDTLPLDEDQRMDRVANDPRSYAAIEVLQNILGREGAEHSATETIRETRERAASLAVLVPRYHHALDVALTDIYRQHLETAFTQHLAQQITLHDAWPAVVRALRRGEQTGRTPDFLLHAIKARGPLEDAHEPATLLAWRINTYLDHKPHRTPATPDDRPTLPAWISPLPLSLGNLDETWTAHLTGQLNLIHTRIGVLTQRTLTAAPAWTTHLGNAPTNDDRRATWTRALGEIAAYRDQYEVDNEDPAQILGPYIPSHSAAHDTYWQAVDTVLAARHAAALDREHEIRAVERGSDAAASLYLSLPEPDRHAITTAMAERLGMLWFGDRIGADDRAATHPAHRRQLIEQLTARGYLNPHTDHEHRRQDTAETQLSEHTRRHANARRAEHWPHRRAAPTHAPTEARQDAEYSGLNQAQPKRDKFPTW